MPDTRDPAGEEDAEWRDALLSLLAADGPARAREIMDMLAALAMGPSIGWVPVRTTPYVNSIGADKQPSFPGDLAIEERLAAIMRWNALAMVVRANKAYGELGGHIASYASGADLFEVGFNHFFRGGQLHYKGGIPLAVAKIHAPVMTELGWHLQLWIDVKDMPDTTPVLKEIGLPVVVDHMGRTDARAGIQTAGFQSLLRAVGEGWCWSKLSGAHRLSQNAPDYPEARAFHEALVRENPERLVWGGDWPHPRIEGKMPNVGHLFELFQEWTPDAAVRQRILVNNPARLYGFS